MKPVYYGMPPQKQRPEKPQLRKTKTGFDGILSGGDDVFDMALSRQKSNMSRQRFVRITEEQVKDDGPSPIGVSSIALKK